MLSPLALAVCLASSTVWAAYVKPNYNVDNAENLFKDFVKDHNKIYEPGEYSERLEIFKETLKDINKRNEMFPDTVFVLTHFADLKPHEILQYNNFKLPNKTLTEGEISEEFKDTYQVFDWRDLNAVSPVKNQGKCGASYIFSAVGNIEGQYAIKHGQCLSFSEGQALDCLDYGSCQEGEIASIIRELASKEKKLETAENYPYKPAKRPCLEDTSKGVVKVTKGDEMILYNEEKIKRKLVLYGPLAIAINANDMLYYKEGILSPYMCSAGLNIGLLLVGYGIENGVKFWIIKNSWGTGWGEEGYVRLQRGVNACGLGRYIAVSTVL